MKVSFPGLSSDPQQAFPTGNPTDGGHLGMSLRDWLAGTAFGHLISADFTDEWTYDEIADHAYLAADALLRRRNRE